MSDDLQLPPPHPDLRHDMARVAASLNRVGDQLRRSRELLESSRQRSENTDWLLARSDEALRRAMRHWDGCGLR